MKPAATDQLSACRVSTDPRPGPGELFATRTRPGLYPGRPRCWPPKAPFTPGCPRRASKPRPPGMEPEPGHGLARFDAMPLTGEPIEALSKAISGSDFGIGLIDKSKSCGSRTRYDHLHQIHLRLFFLLKAFAGMLAVVIPTQGVTWSTCFSRPTSTWFTNMASISHATPPADEGRLRSGFGPMSSGSGSGQLSDLRHAEQIFPLAGIVVRSSTARAPEELWLCPGVEGPLTEAALSVIQAARWCRTSNPGRENLSLPAGLMAVAPHDLRR